MKTNTFLILGGYGNTGSVLARFLLQETSLNLVLAGRNESRASAAAAELNRRFPGERVSGRQADASDPASLRRAFQEIDLSRALLHH
ncbi:MAG: KR domain-containing protein [Anaerolineales bacterium]|nr:KR domain-containing protein [Anaerolineales bacterium]